MIALERNFKVSFTTVGGVAGSIEAVKSILVANFKKSKSDFK